MPRDQVALVFSQQAGACARLGSPLYGALLERVARDIKEEGPCAAVLEGYEDTGYADALALRMMGAVHALVLTGRSPELAEHYPSAGGVFDPEHPDAGWPAFRAAVAAEPDWVRDWLERPPQTNEVGRASLLLAGLLYAVPTAALPIRLFELGSSAGLNLRAEQFHYRAPSFSWGNPDSPVRLDPVWRGDPPGWLTEGARRHQTLRIVERRGCDITPLDPLSPDGALALRAYVWPDQADRTRRLEGALRIAAKVPATVGAAGAAQFLSGVELEPGTLTVVWHSVMRQYVPDAEWAAVERELDRLAAASGPEAGFAHIAFEPRTVGELHRFALSVRLGREPEECLAFAAPHGLPAWSPGQD